MKSHDDPLAEYLLRIGDNCLILGHRLSEWVGHSPAIEEELGVANVALDLLGQSRLWLGLAGEIENRGRDEDKLAYLRDAGEFRNLLLVEQPNGDFAQTIARQFYFDAWHYLLLSELSKCADARLADIASKAFKEVSYHLRRSRDWVIVLGDGTAESHQRMQDGIDDFWSYTGEMFEADALDRDLHTKGIAVDPADLREPWIERVHTTLAQATLTAPQSTWTQRGGRAGIHSENLGFVLAEMQFLQRAYPNATW